MVSSDHPLKIKAHKVKGQCHEIFDYSFFYNELVSPKSLSIPPVSAFKTAGVIDARCKFSTGINNTSGTSGKKTNGVVDTDGAPLSANISVNLWKILK